MNESPRIDAWLVARLKADTGVGGLFHAGTAVGTAARVSGIWSERIPAGEQLPGIRFSDLAPRDVGGVSGVRILVTGLYVVAAVRAGASYGPLVPVADRIDELLQRASGAAPDGFTVLSCIRESAFRLPEDDGDIHYRHLGGVYRIQLSG